MTDSSTSETTDGVPTYAREGDAAGEYADYFPPWLAHLADDVTIEGSLLDGAARGPEAVRKIIGAIRTLYEKQDFNFAGPYRDGDWIEDYNARVRGEPIACVVVIGRDADGQTTSVAANYRPRRSLLLLSRLVGEELAGTPYASYFLGGAP